MKLIATIASVLFTALSFAQFPINDKGKIEYTNVVAADSLNATELFGKARLFLSKAFNSGKETTELTDEQNNVVSAKGWAPVYITSLGVKYEQQLWFSFTIQCKAGRYKYTIDNVYLVSKGTKQSNEYYFENGKGAWFSNKQWDSVKEQADNILKSLIADLKKNMVKTADTW